MLADAQGIPLQASVTAANVNKVTQAPDLLVNEPAVRGMPGLKPELPERVHGEVRRIPSHAEVAALAGDHACAAQAATQAWYRPG